ncbi:hypothetical protein ASG11_14550 [Sphingomonas sp. Leaf357]|uniref:hypothetical protein n=1 Tax=Sphingomonas sp. Leaf357 TaxID=1736350 RepID=UPI0006FA1258|nr:hypothetical protein [Sphingomonas sp. Leaf357]KQS02021.1 hypothetical protein ASG11_14550 [Sphingomonas sp. Leaf357]
MIHDQDGKVRVLFELTLADMACLWDAAALESATVHAMTEEEIVETLGPRDDPDAAACAAMLFDTIARRSGAIEATTITVAQLDGKAVQSADMLPAAQTLRDRMAIAR